MNNKILVSIDFDNSIYEGFAIADLLFDYAKKMKRTLFLYYPLVKLINTFLQVIGKIFEERTGETLTLKVIDHLIFKKHPIPVSFIDEEAERIANKIPKEMVEKLNKIKDYGIELIINTAEPVEYVSKILDYAGINYDEVLGNNFDVRGKFIYGFKNPLVAGISGKLMRLNYYIKGRNYDRIISIGDSKSDSIGDSITVNGNLEEVLESIIQERIPTYSPSG